MQIVRLTYNGNEMQLTINSTTAYLNGVAQTLETAPVVINDRTMLPIRFVAGSFDFYVSWDDANQLVTIKNTPQDEAGAVLEAGIVTSRDDLTFPVGDAVSGAFTGMAYLTPMINNDEIYHFPQTNNVTFEPEARSYWHSHGGIIMIGTGGIGYYQEEGRLIIHKGDVVECPEGEKHWHGGSADASFAYIAVNTNKELTGLEWFDRISDEEYDSLAELITE